MGKRTRTEVTNTISGTANGTVIQAGDIVGDVCVTPAQNGDVTVTTVTYSGNGVTVIDGDNHSGISRSFGRKRR